MPHRAVRPTKDERRIAAVLIADVVRDALSSKHRPSQFDVKARARIAANAFLDGLASLSPGALPDAPNRRAGK